MFSDIVEIFKIHNVSMHQAHNDIIESQRILLLKLKTKLKTSYGISI